MAKQSIEDAEIVEEAPKKTVMDRAEDGQQAVNRFMYFVDWVRSVFDWVKGLVGR